MEIEAIIDMRLAEAQRAAAEARASIVRLIAFVRGETRCEPTAEEVRAFARATGARDTGRDDASRLVRAVRVRSALLARRDVAISDFAVAVGLSRQYVWRRYGARVPYACAEAEFARRYPCTSA